MAGYNTAFFQGIVSLYYLIIHADGNIHDKEVKIGELMCEVEGIKESEFHQFFATLEQKDRDEIYDICLLSLKKCNRANQIKIIAWMSKITNCDGHMDTSEWNLIYLIYYKELGLNLGEILKTQKNLPNSLAV